MTRQSGSSSADQPDGSIDGSIDRSIDAGTGLDAPDAALAAALARQDAGAGGTLLTLDEVAEAAGVVPAVVEALVREGLLAPRASDPDRWSASDAEAVRDGLALVEAGVPLGEVLELARLTDEGLRNVAEKAVDTFLAFVRDPVRGTTDDDDDAATRLVDAFDTMLPATGRLLASHFERLVVEAARDRLDQADRPASNGAT